MDEIDSIGGTRMDSGRGGDSEVQRTMLEVCFVLALCFPYLRLNRLTLLFLFVASESTRWLRALPTDQGVDGHKSY